MKVYILRADGSLAELSGHMTHIHSKAFRTKPAAKARQAAFRKRCVTPKSKNDLTYMVDSKDLEIRVLELTLQDEGDAGC